MLQLLIALKPKLIKVVQLVLVILFAPRIQVILIRTINRVLFAPIN